MSAAATTPPLCRLPETSKVGSTGTGGGLYTLTGAALATPGAALATPGDALATPGAALATPGAVV